MPRIDVPVLHRGLRPLFRVALCSQLLWPALAFADTPYDQMVRDARADDEGGIREAVDHFRDCARDTRAGKLDDARYVQCTDPVRVPLGPVILAKRKPLQATVAYQDAQAAEIAAQEGTSVEVIDMRSLSPIDYAPIVASVQKTGRLVVAQEAQGNASVGSEIAATVAERAFYALQAPPLRVSGFDVPFPPAKLEGVYLPDADRVLEAVDRALDY